MADATVNAADVAKGSDSGLAHVTYGATITQGLVVHKDTSDGKWKIAHCETSALTAGSAGFGVALSSGEDGQPGLILATGADTPFDPGFAATQGVIYVLSASGGIAPHADLATNDWVSIIGVGDSSGNIVPILKATGAQVQ